MLIGLYRQNPVTHICKQVKVYEQVNNDIYYKQVALYNFEKALEADPNNSVAKEYVKKLKPKKGLFSFFQ